MGMEKSRAISGGHWGGRPPEGSARHFVARASFLSHPVLALASRTTCRSEAALTTYLWNRVQQTSQFANVGWFGQDLINSGSTYRRVRWSWGFSGVTADTVDVNSIISNPIVAGWVTTIGTGSETPPNPVTGAVDVDPPTQRWLWWEMRQPIPIAVDHAAGIITWRDSGPQEVPDIRTQVLATGIPSGEFLNLWFTWAQINGGGWDPSGSFRIWVASSVLSSTP